MTLAQAILSREGLRVSTGSRGCFGERVERLGLPQQLAAEIAPLLAMLMPLNEQIGLPPNPLQRRRPTERTQIRRNG